MPTRLHAHMPALTVIDDVPAPESDPVRVAFWHMTLKVERLVRRMVTFWDPAWGRYQLIEGPSAPAPYIQFSPYVEGKITLSRSFLGLAIHVPGEDFSPRNLRVLASDHIDAEGNVLPPPDGPFPLPELSRVATS